MERGREVSVERGPGHCPFCKDEVGPADDLVACGACAARHHAECHAEGGDRCSACGSTDALVRRGAGEREPRDRAPAGPGRTEPLHASKIEVQRDADAARLEWDGRHWVDLLLAALAFFYCFTAPLALWILVRRERTARVTLSFTPDALELRTGVFSAATRRLARRDLDRVEVYQGPKGSTALFLEAGAERIPVATAALFGQPLSLPELRWLQGVIEAWRTSGKLP
jgi:hypothetical protein